MMRTPVGEAPPTYAQEYPEEDAAVSETQVLIIPATSTFRFQQGYLGADVNERASIEGELQIKGADGDRWRKVTMSLRTTERTRQHSTELAHSEAVLYDADADAPLALTSSVFPFSLPLTPDTPQCIHTPQSSLSHILTATLYPSPSPSTPDATQPPPLTKSIPVHTRRFTPHTQTLSISPVTRVNEQTTRVQVELPRTTFTASEAVPIYVTVPSPRREVVVERGLQLRNVRAELIRVVTVRSGDGEEEDVTELDGDTSEESEDSEEEEDQEMPMGISMPSHEKPPIASSSASAGPGPATIASTTRSFGGRRTVYKTLISRSGAVCRFHTSLPVRLRFILHQTSPTSSPDSSPHRHSDAHLHPLHPHPQHAHPPEEFGIGLLDNDTECASITQSTLYHTTAFRILVHASFINTSTHTEQISTVTVPVRILPPPAPLPEVEPDMESAYHKKHDRPPARTVRGEDAGMEAAPNYEEGQAQAGPSFTAAAASGEPPPFEEREGEAPPPSFAEASTSTRLPTFQESEHEIFVPSHEASMSTSISLLSSPPPPSSGMPSHLVIPGEGILFGFPPSSQFDGHSHANNEVERAHSLSLSGRTTPPPTLEQATLDTNVSDLARLPLDTPERAMHALNLVQQAEVELELAGVGGEEAPPPPPPPAMDDPSDPPPSIHSEYRSREGVPHQIQATRTRTQSSLAGSPPGLNISIPQPAHSVVEGTRSHAAQAGVGGVPPSPNAHAPPPYLTPGDHESENVARPPPYVDVMPEHAT